MSEPTCRTYDVDGEPVSVHGDEPMDAEDLKHLSEIIRAARRKFDNRNDEGADS